MLPADLADIVREYLMRSSEAVHHSYEVLVGDVFNLYHLQRFVDTRWSAIHGEDDEPVWIPVPRATLYQIELWRPVFYSRNFQI